ncbi:MAG: sigma-54-dependent Fis family transcriptional regulator [Methylophilus sp.]|nr:sigma-54-dependent Fis family transcriptional regulator [Methylophilus sp.]
MNTESSKKASNIVLARQQFIARGNLQVGTIAEEIERSWRRCLDNGVDENAPKDMQVLTAHELSIRQEKNQLLIAHAEPEMATLTEQIAHTRSLVVLTDHEGVILRSMGDQHFIDDAQRVSLSPGASWNEAHRGTNAIGTALMEQSAMTVQGAEHFMSYHHALSCSAVPIFDAQNALLATLDVSNDLSTPQQHTLALVKMAAQMIENRLFRASYQADFALHFHVRPEFIGTLWEGIAMFSDEGELMGINRSGQFQLNFHLNQRAMLAQSIQFDQLFDISVAELKKQALGNASMLFPLRFSNGARVYARVQSLVQSKRPHVTQPMRRTSAASLDMLNSGDPQIALAIKQVKQVLTKSIPILIQGETGVGKELFARAIHEASDRANQPWIAVNCAALPEGLIEAELFGYEEGAFTGAKRKGSIGRIEQADGGTLFLDEIGDMPLSLQARLLRVLQERTVTPLGSAKSKPVNFSLISATNQKLKEKVAAGEFRSDLYYRINGLSVSLPALRERTDLDKLIHLILQIEQVAHAEITPQVMQIFENHPWPGNIRQLHNVIRTAIALADDMPIAKEHFTKDFIDELLEQNDVAQQVSGAQKPLKSVASPLLKEVADDLVQRAMQQHQGNVSAVARQLGISRNTLYRKLKSLGLM